MDKGICFIDWLSRCDVSRDSLGNPPPKKKTITTTNKQTNNKT